jgi:hypothetical protein
VTTHDFDQVFLVKIFFDQVFDENFDSDNKPLE